VGRFRLYSAALATNGEQPRLIDGSSEPEPTKHASQRDMTPGQSLRYSAKEANAVLDKLGMPAHKLSLISAPNPATKTDDGRDVIVKHRPHAAYAPKDHYAWVRSTPHREYEPHMLAHEWTHHLQAQMSKEQRATLEKHFAKDHPSNYPDNVPNAMEWHATAVEPYRHDALSRTKYQRTRIKRRKLGFGQYGGVPQP
jgi:hypothetical protein